MCGPPFGYHKFLAQFIQIYSRILEMTRTWIIINTHKLQKKVAGNLLTTNTFKKRPHAQNKSNLFLFVLVRKFLYANEKQCKKNMNQCG